MVVAVASPSSAAPSAGRPHPPYKEMILQALTELRDPSGSSRHAIASYIADHFTGLHARHDALLSVHLRRLSSQGQLRLVSGNYFVSAATPQLGPGQKRGRGRPRKNPDLAPSAPAPVFQGPKRGRGRPRKDALDLVLFSDSPLQGASAPPPPSGVKRGRGRPRKNALVPVPSSSPLLGAISPPPPSRVKRGRGRPRKNALVPVPSSSSQLLGAIAPPPPPPSGVKRGRGRPRKNALVLVPSSSSQLLGAIAPPPPSGVKRGRGRPRKNALVPVGSSSSPLLGATAPWSPSGVKWGRGRPRKNAQGPGGQPQRYITPLSLLPVAMPRSGKSKSDRLPKVAIDNSALPGSSTKISAGSNSVVGAKRGRGRPLKVVVAGKKKRGRPPKEKMRPESVQSVYASLTKRGRGRPRKEKALDSGHLKASQITEGRHEVLTVQAADQTGAVQNEVEAKSLQSGGTLTEKRGRGRPRKRPLETEAAEAAFPGEKRGPGRPRKEMALATEHLKAAQMTEGLHEALPAQAANQAGAVQNEVEPRSLQSCGISLKEKRGLGRPRKRPLETETAETKIAALMKRGRGRPRKESPLAGRSTGTRDTELTEIKRGRGRPRKARPFETGSVETAIEVSRDLTEEKPENDGDLVSGKKAEAQGVLLVEGIDNGPIDAECVVLPEEEVAIASMAAGGVLLSGEESAVAPMDAGGATPRVDPSDSNVGTESH